MKLHYNITKIEIFDIENELFNHIVNEICETDLDYHSEDDQDGNFSVEIDLGEDEPLIEVTGRLQTYGENGGASLYDEQMMVTLPCGQVEAKFHRPEETLDNDNIEDYLSDIEMAVHNYFKTH